MHKVQVPKHKFSFTFILLSMQLSVKSFTLSCNFMEYVGQPGRFPCIVNKCIYLLVHNKYLSSQLTSNHNKVLHTISKPLLTFIL